MTKEIFEKRINKKAKSVKIIGDNIKDKEGIYYNIYYGKKIVSAVVKYEKKKYILVVKNMGWIQFKTEREMYDFLNKLVFNPNKLNVVEVEKNKLEYMVFEILIFIILGYLILRNVI